MRKISESVKNTVLEILSLTQEETQRQRFFDGIYNGGLCNEQR